MSRPSEPIRAYREGGIIPFVKEGVKAAFQDAIERAGLRLPYYVTKSTLESRRSMATLSKKGVGPQITEVPLTEYKTSDTLFVLGSGSSITDITDTQWAHIDQMDTVGLNRWPVHEFTPTYHVFELPLGHEDFVQKYWDLLNYRKESYSGVPLILKDASRVRDVLDPDRLPEWLAGDLIVSSDSSFYPAVTLQSTKLENDHLLRYLDSKGYFDLGQITTLYRLRGSISYLIHLGTVLRYDTIVLCGVDMIDSSYFFDAEHYLGSDVPIPRHRRQSGDESDEHDTNDPDIGSLTLEKIIYSMNDVVLKPRGIDLYVENEVSALHPQIPSYEY